jgi:hypothetical protein
VGTMTSNSKPLATNCDFDIRPSLRDEMYRPDGCTNRWQRCLRKSLSEASGQVPEDLVKFWKESATHSSQWL